MENPTPQDILSPELYETVKDHPDLVVLSMDIPKEAEEAITDQIAKGKCYIKAGERNVHVIGAVKIAGSDEWFMAAIFMGVTN